MESSQSSGPPRDRIQEAERISTNQDGVRKEAGGLVAHSNPLTEASRMHERKKVQAHPSSKPPAVASTHQRSCVSLDKFVPPSSGSGSLDLQPSSSSRSGSSIAGMTVPIRLDALSYLLNNALMGAYKMPSPVPFYGGQYIPSACQPCPFTQVGGTPYSTCMSQPHGSMPCQNQSCQPGYTMCVNQQCVQACQPQTPNYVQSNTATVQNPYPGYAFQSGVTQGSVSTVVSSGNAGHSQDGNGWPRKASDGLATSTNNQRFSDNDRNRFSPQQSFGKFEDNQNGNSWSGKQQSDFNRGRGRAEFAIRTWQSNSRGQDKERRFGDRPRNCDAFSRNGESFSRSSDAFSNRRGFGSPERSQGRGQYSKRGRWSGGRDRAGDTRDTWQQRNRQDNTPTWSEVTATRSRSDSGADLNLQQQPAKSEAGDEDWENEYPDDAAPKTKTVEPTCQRGLSAGPPLASTLANDSEITEESQQKLSVTEDNTHKSASDEGRNRDENKESDIVKSPKGHVSDPCYNSEDGNKDSNSEILNVEVGNEVKVPHNETDPTSGSLSEGTGHLQLVDSHGDAGGKDIYTLLLSVENEENKEIVLELVEASDGLADP